VVTVGCFDGLIGVLGIVLSSYSMSQPHKAVLAKVNCGGPVSEEVYLHVPARGRSAKAAGVRLDKKRVLLTRAKTPVTSGADLRPDAWSKSLVPFTPRTDRKFAGGRDWFETRPYEE
jgi:hypothetical protein